MKFSKKAQFAVGVVILLFVGMLFIAVGSSGDQNALEEAKQELAAQEAQEAAKSTPEKVEDTVKPEDSTTEYLAKQLPLIERLDDVLYRMGKLSDLAAQNPLVIQDEIYIENVREVNIEMQAIKTEVDSIDSVPDQLETSDALFRKGVESYAGAVKAYESGVINQSIEGIEESTRLLLQGNDYINQATAEAQAAVN